MNGMHVHFLDPFQDLRSPVHALDARVKLVLALAFILTVSLSPIGAWPLYMLLFALSVSVILLSNLGVAYVLRRAIVAVPFALAALPRERTGGCKLEMRMGINLGDVVIDGEDIQGDGVNVAARLEGAADPGGVCFSTYKMPPAM